MSDSVQITAMISGTSIFCVLMITRALVTSAYQEAATKIANHAWEISKLENEIRGLKRHLGLDKN